MVSAKNLVFVTDFTNVPVKGTIRGISCREIVMRWLFTGVGSSGVGSSDVGNSDIGSGSSDVGGRRKEIAANHMLKLETQARTWRSCK